MTTPSTRADAEPDLSTEPANAPVASPVASPTCANCDTALAGDFCHACGQRRVGPGDLRVRRFAAGAVREVSDVNSVLLSTLATLALRPGQLTLDYLAGRRARHYNPVGLYLLASALYLLVAWGPFLELQDMERGLRASKEFAALRGAYRGDEHAFVAELMERTGDYMAYARFVSVAGFALVVQMLFRRPRRPYVAHLVFALHYYAFDFGFYTLLLAPLMVHRWITGHWPPAWIVSATIPVLVWYAYAAARRVYAESPLRSAIKTAVLLLGDIVLTSLGSVIALAAARAMMM